MAVRRSRRKSTAPQAYDPDAEAARPQFASTTDTGKAKLRRNYVGKESMLKTLRASDFEEKEQHDGNELRAEVHHDYNESHLADKAAHEHRSGPHKKKAAPKKSAKKSPSPAPKSRSPSPAPTRKSASPSPPKRASRSPSPSLAPEPQDEEPKAEEEVEEPTGADAMQRILLLIVLAIVAYYGATQPARPRAPLVHVAGYQRPICPACDELSVCVCAATDMHAGAQYLQKMQAVPSLPGEAEETSPPPSLPEGDN